MTKEFWRALHPDIRVRWVHLSAGVAFAVGYAGTRTGLRPLDAGVAFAASRLTAAVIDLQRNYGGYTPAFRARVVRRVVTAGTWGATLFGVAVFGLLGAAAVASAFLAVLPPAAWRTLSAPGCLLLLATFAVGALRGVLRPFRMLQVEALIHAAPRAALTRLLVGRPFRTTTMATFAAFESAVVIAGALSTSLACDLVVGLVQIVRA